MRRKALQVVVQLLGDVLEVHLFLDVECSLFLLGQDVCVDVFLEAAAELGDVFYAECQSYGIGVSAEVLENVAA